MVDICVQNDMKLYLGTFVSQYPLGRYSIIFTCMSIRTIQSTHCVSKDKVSLSRNWQIILE